MHMFASSSIANQSPLTKPSRFLCISIKESSPQPLDLTSTPHTQTTIKHPNSKSSPPMDAALTEQLGGREVVYDAEKGYLSEIFHYLATKKQEQTSLDTGLLEQIHTGPPPTSSSSPTRGLTYAKRSSSLDDPVIRTTKNDEVSSVNAKEDLPGTIRGHANADTNTHSNAIEGGDNLADEEPRLSSRRETEEAHMDKEKATEEDKEGSSSTAVGGVTDETQGGSIIDQGRKQGEENDGDKGQACKSVPKPNPGEPKTDNKAKTIEIAELKSSINKDLKTKARARSKKGCAEAILPKPKMKQQASIQKGGKIAEILPHEPIEKSPEILYQRKKNKVTPPILKSKVTKETQQVKSFRKVSSPHSFSRRQCVSSSASSCVFLGESTTFMLLKPEPVESATAGGRRRPISDPIQAEHDDATGTDFDSDVWLPSDVQRAENDGNRQHTINDAESSVAINPGKKPLTAFRSKVGNPIAKRGSSKDFRSTPKSGVTSATNAQVSEPQPEANRKRVNPEQNQPI